MGGEGGGAGPEVGRQAQPGLAKGGGGGAAGASVQDALAEVAELLDEGDDVLPLLGVSPDALLRIAVKLDRVCLKRLLRVYRDGRLLLLLVLFAPSGYLDLLPVLRRKLNVCGPLHVLLLLLLLVEDLAPLPEEARRLHVLRALALARRTLALELRRAARADVGLPLGVLLGLLLAAALVRLRLLLHLLLHALVLVVLHVRQAPGLRLDHGVPGLLLLLEDLLLLLLSELQHLLLPHGVVLDLLLLLLLPQPVLGLDLLQVLVGLHRLPHSPHCLVTAALLCVSLPFQIFQGLPPQQLTLEH
mmetsp:Transcript_22102/g.68976  ORF Transcript_22102/g.68976 Transcript_22102/m.68976 type:complete len:302 (-) Transcript_22102:626-1531(-)